MSKVINALSIVSLKVFLPLLFVFSVLAEQHHIAVTQIIDHSALNQVFDGIKEQLSAEGLENCKITFDNAQGNIPVASQIAQKFAGLSPDLIVAISTPSALSCVKAVYGKIPVIFAAVSNPKESGLEQKNVTGVSDYVPVEKILNLVEELLGKQVKGIGVPFNSGEPSSLYIITQLRKVCSEKKITLIEASVSKVSEIPAAVEKLVSSKEVEVIIEPNDNTVHSAVSLLIKAANEHKVPLFVVDKESVEQGGLASLCTDYKEHGKDCAKVIARVLKGENLNKIPVSAVENPKIFINEKTASSLGIKLNSELIKKATQIWR